MWKQPRGGACPLGWRRLLGPLPAAGGDPVPRLQEAGGVWAGPASAVVQAGVGRWLPPPSVSPR